MILDLFNIFRKGRKALATIECVQGGSLSPASVLKYHCWWCLGKPYVVPETEQKLIVYKISALTPVLSPWPD